MSNDDEETGLMGTARAQPSKPLIIFSFIPLVFPKKFNLSLFNWKKSMILAWSLQSMLFISLCALMKPKWEIYSKMSIITAIVAPIIGYGMVLLNMFNNGWGKEDSKFWCHMRIMYLSGYNTIRWTISSIVDPCIIIAANILMGKDIDQALSIAVSTVYCYYVLATLERAKSQPIDWEKFKNDFDVGLTDCSDSQEKNIKSVGAEPVILCVLLTILPWVVTGWNIGFFIMVYQIIMCINIYRYISSAQTFVQTDTQYDIIQIVFRMGLTWSFIWIS